MIILQLLQYPGKRGDKCFQICKRRLFLRYFSENAWTLLWIREESTTCSFELFHRMAICNIGHNFFLQNWTIFLAAWWRKQPQEFFVPSFFLKSENVDAMLPFFLQRKFHFHYASQRKKKNTAGVVGVGEGWQIALNFKRKANWKFVIILVSLNENSSPVFI